MGLVSFESGNIKASIGGSGWDSQSQTGKETPNMRLLKKMI